MTMVSDPAQGAWLSLEWLVDPVSVTSYPGMQQAFLHDALVELASSADHQAACASAFDSTAASSALFLLADELRSMARQVTTNPAADRLAALDAAAAQGDAVISSLKRADS